MIEGIKSSAKAAGTKGLAIHFGGDSKWRAVSKAAAHRAEIGMIEDIKEIGSELKVDTVSEIELSPERQVYLK